jgi:hypothetical protein
MMRLKSSEYADKKCKKCCVALTLFTWALFVWTFFSRKVGQKKAEPNRPFSGL